MRHYKLKIKEWLNNLPFYSYMKYLRIFKTKDYQFNNVYKVNTFNSSDEEVLTDDFNKIFEDFDKIIEKEKFGKQNT